jgi:hypothetical protein
MDWEREDLARRYLERANVGTPVDPDELADGLKLEVRDGGPGCEGVLLGDTIIVDEELRPERRAFAIAHEIGHFIQRAERLRDSERGADYFAAALLQPRFEFESHLRRYGWDLIRLHALHRFASFEAIARRIVALREARAVVFDKPLVGQRRPFWYSVPSGLRPTENERTAANEAVRCGAPVEIVTGCTAWPVLEHDWHRVITVTAA